MPASIPTYQGLPYLSDFGSLRAVGNDFYGVFAANNTPDYQNFPQGVVYQRIHSSGQLLSSPPELKSVAPSIDPFFFKVVEEPIRPAAEDPLGVIE